MLICENTRVGFQIFRNDKKLNVSPAKFCISLKYQPLAVIKQLLWSQGFATVSCWLILLENHFPFQFPTILIFSQESQVVVVGSKPGEGKSEGEPDSVLLIFKSHAF